MIIICQATVYVIIDEIAEFLTVIIITHPDGLSSRNSRGKGKGKALPIILPTRMGKPMGTVI